MATIVGMALGGWMSGVIFDLTGSYWRRFLNGIAWNLLNVAIMPGCCCAAGGAPPPRLTPSPLMPALQPKPVVVSRSDNAPPRRIRRATELAANARAIARVIGACRNAR